VLNESITVLIVAGIVFFPAGVTLTRTPELLRGSCGLDAAGHDRRVPST
jgi:hypothetical protein